MNGHSPAPWHAFPVVGGWAISEDKLQAPVAKVYAEREARLIAAAPELLEAVATLKVYLHDALFHANYPERTMPAATFEAASAAVEEAGRLLAKARGGA